MSEKPTLHKRSHCLVHPTSLGEQHLREEKGGVEGWRAL